MNGASIRAVSRRRRLALRRHRLHGKIVERHTRSLLHLPDLSGIVPPLRALGDAHSGANNGRDLVIRHSHFNVCKGLPSKSRSDLVSRFASYRENAIMNIRVSRPRPQSHASQTIEPCTIKIALMSIVYRRNAILLE